MLPVWTSKKQRSQQRRPPFQLEKQPSMAPTKRKAPASTTSNSTEPGHVLDGSPPQHEEANPRIENITTEAVLHGDLVEDSENTEAHQTQSAELTEAALKLKALEMKKKNIEAQLATKKRALDQANKLAEVRRRLAEMEAEVESLQRHTKKCPKVPPSKKTASSSRQPSLTMKTKGHHRSTSHLTRPRHSQLLCSELHGHSATSPHSSPSTMLQQIQLSSS